MRRFELYVAAGLALLAPIIEAVFHSTAGAVVLVISAIVFFTLACFATGESEEISSTGILFPDGIPQPPKATESTQSDSTFDSGDPRIYVADLLDETTLFVPSTPLLLENKGGAVAHNVRVKPILVGHYKIDFFPIDSIGVGSPQKAIPQFYDAGGSCNAFFFILRDEWKAKLKAQGPGEEAITFPVSILYTDFSGKFEYETVAKISYFPLRHEINNEAKGNKWEDWPHETFSWRLFAHESFKKIKRP